MDYLMGQGSNSINLEEITFENLPDGLKNKSIRELRIKDKSGENIIGFKTPQCEYIINASPNIVIRTHAKIFVLGALEQINTFGEFATQQNILNQ